MGSHLGKRDARGSLEHHQRNRKGHDSPHFPVSRGKARCRIRGTPLSTPNSPKENPHFLRCFHHALQPAIFCTNHQTRDRFRTCSGPGFDSIAHLKDHMRSHHTKKHSALKCSHCQEVFKNQNLLQVHTDTVDCSLKCPECDKTFDTKSSRKVHQEETHIESDTTEFLEIDDVMWTRIKENLKKFSASPKTGEFGHDPNLDISRWMSKNTPRYMLGRPADAKPNLELGQWYTIFCSLSSSDNIPEHPFYDYPSVTKLLSERVLGTFRTSVKAKIDSLDSPPSDLHGQLKWYEEILQETLEMALFPKLVTEIEGSEKLESLSPFNRSDVPDTTITPSPIPDGIFWGSSHCEELLSFDPPLSFKSQDEYAQQGYGNSLAFYSQEVAPDYHNLDMSCFSSMNTDLATGFEDVRLPKRRHQGAGSI